MTPTPGFEPGIPEGEVCLEHFGKASFDQTFPKSLFKTSAIPGYATSALAKTLNVLFTNYHYDRFKS